ncbi:putative glycerol kinase [Tilletiopsis washingtonensis]|uniref:glycerol kinase n=1 Tax=Tilletiopsis washingtonensis TaxID=58919 RepID=A0A316ZLY9_9BASI|nr:putative glycerol kinase [Tilletiopsis washingtonensis]PWO01406.1 putative glycerol kinase [Tilletiopsis washingtonensis]
MPDFVGSIDAGTTSVRFMIFNERAEVQASHGLEFTQFFEHPGWQDQDAHEIVDKVNECIDVAVRQLEESGKGSKKDIKVIGITNQRETTVVWDKKTGRALTRAIAWPDTRTTHTVRQLAEKSDKGTDAVKLETGLPLSTYFAALKLRWMLDNIPEVKKAHDDKNMLFGTVDSWLLYNLTGRKVHYTDASNASRTMFMDLRKQTWDPKLCDFFGIDMDILPEIKSSSEVYGTVAEGTLQGVEIAGLIGDQMGALIGQKALTPGEAKNTYGTGAFLLYNTGDKVVDSKNGLLSTIAYKAGPNAEPVYALEGSIAVCGSAIKWLRDSIGLIKEAAEVGELAEGVEDTGGVYFVTAFSGLLCPYWDDTASGMIIGMTGYTDKRHIARATIEAACYQTQAVLAACEKDSGVPLASLQVDGGMTNSDIIMQIQADILGLTVERPEMRETTALGSALLAGAAKGLFGWDLSKPETLKDVNAAGKQKFEPSISAERRKELLHGWERAVERCKAWNESP